MIVHWVVRRFRAIFITTIGACLTRREFSRQSVTTQAGKPSRMNCAPLAPQRGFRSSPFQYPSPGILPSVCRLWCFCCCGVLVVERDVFGWERWRPPAVSVRIEGAGNLIGLDTGDLN